MSNYKKNYPSGSAKRKNMEQELLKMQAHDPMQKN